MRKGIAAGLAAAALAAGCNIVPTKAYDGPARNRDELSLIKGGGSGEELSPVSLVDLRAIDGARQREGTYLVSVLPGRHSVVLSETLRIGVATRTQFCAFDLEALAGCLYVPRPPSPPSDARAGRDATWQWSVDMPVAAECIAGNYHMRVPARCGSSMQLLESSKP